MVLSGLRFLSDVRKSWCCWNGSFFLCIYSYVSSNALVCTEYNKRESTVGPAGVDIPSLWKCHFAGNTQYPVSYPICAYAVFNTHYAVFRGYIHDLSSVERIQKK